MKSFAPFLILVIAMPATTSAQKIAITIDDVPGRSASGNCDYESTWTMNRRILDALDQFGAPAVGFVTESVVCASRRDSVLRNVLSMWLDRGFSLGNHTFSHPDLNSTATDDFKQDIVTGERMTLELMSDRGLNLKYFRYPQLHTGNTLQKKEHIASFLSDRGYTNAPVTIDSQEWLFAAAYQRALSAGDTKTAACIGEAYVPFMGSVVSFFERWAIEVVGYGPPQVLLLHANELNADYLPELLTTLSDRGYTFISLDEALEDRAYDRDDSYVGPRGLSWIHRWALSDGMELREEEREPSWLQNPASYCHPERP